MTISSRIHRKRAGIRGFSLLELTLVLLIFSMLIGMLLGVRIATMAEEKTEITNKRLDEIQKQLQWFRQVNHRLPCPSVPTVTIASASYGRESRTGTCDSSLSGYPGTMRYAAGTIPTKTIGLSDDYMYDGFGRRIRYVVMQEFTRDCAFVTYPISASGRAGMVINDEAGTASNSEALYVLVSHGMNGHGGYMQSGSRYDASSTNTAEQQNCDCSSAAVDTGVNGTFVDMLYKETTTASNRYDDILRYASREQIIASQDIDGTTETCP